MEELVQGEDGNEANVSFMYPHGPKTSFQWPTPEDICCVPADHVLGRLKSHPEPRGLRNFCISPAAMDEAEDLYLDFVIE